MRPRVAITLGDPGGIGPEICLKAVADPAVQDACSLLLVGDFFTAEAAAALVQSPFQVCRVEYADHPPLEANEIAVLDTVSFADSGRRQSYTIGGIHAPNGKAAHRWIVDAANLALNGQADAICTAPISKEAMFAAGFTFPGHTELLAELCGGHPVRMMLEGGGLHVALETIHIALADVPQLITTAGIFQSLQIMHKWSNLHALQHPRIAVCGLNPHAGEGGHFGSEESEIIAPAIAQAVGRGINASGPHPADTVFHRALGGDFDLILAMYHDQALIPVKTLDFHRGVNVTLGLPIIRTSPDHGTAFDIAGKGTARESSMVSAILRAAELATKQ